MSPLKQTKVMIVPCTLAPPPLLQLLSLIMLLTHSEVVYLCMCAICSVIVIVCCIQNIYDLIISFRRNLTLYALCAFSGTSVSSMRQFDTGMQNM